MAATKVPTSQRGTPTVSGYWAFERYALLLVACRLSWHRIYIHSDTFKYLWYTEEKNRRYPRRVWIFSHPTSDMLAKWRSKCQSDSVWRGLMCAYMEYGVTLDYSSLKQVGRRRYYGMERKGETIWSTHTHTHSRVEFFHVLFMGEGELRWRRRRRRKKNLEKSFRAFFLFSKDRHVFAPEFLDCDEFLLL